MTSATCARRSGRRSSSGASPGTTSTASRRPPSAVAAASDDELERYLDALASAPRAAGWPYDEPSEPAGDRGRAAAGSAPRAPLARRRPALGDRILGAWLGRCAGCALGKPVERLAARGDPPLPRARGAYPIEDYLPPPSRCRRACRAPPVVDRDDARAHRRDAARRRHRLHDPRPAHAREARLRLRPGDVADEWLRHLPFTQVYTAERAAYRNLIHGLRPPETATRTQPVPRVDRRADPRRRLGVRRRPGDPRGAAALAFRDATLSHTGERHLRRDVGGGADRRELRRALDLPAALDSALAFVPAALAAGGGLAPRAATARRGPRLGGGPRRDRGGATATTASSTRSTTPRWSPRRCCGAKATSRARSGSPCRAAGTRTATAPRPAPRSARCTARGALPGALGRAA